MNLNRLNAGYSLILVLPVLCIVTSCHFFRERGLFLNRKKAIESIQAERARIEVRDTVRRVFDSTVISTQEPAEPSIMTGTEQITYNPSLTYRIIVGSFTTVRNAKDMAEKYRKLGYTAEVIRLKNKPSSLLVSIFAFDTREKADEQLQAIKGSINKAAWIYSGEIVKVTL